MFTVKATYNSETRKFTFHELSFPTFQQLTSQLYRVFPISGSYYLSKILFSPTENSKILIGREAHNELEYINLTAPYIGRIWPGGLLRFSVLDETPHKLPSAVRSATLPLPTPILPTPRSSIMHQHNTVDSTRASHRVSIASVASHASRTSCCSVDEGKREVQELMSTFVQDLDRILSTKLVEEPQPSFATPRVAPVDFSDFRASTSEQKDSDASAPLHIPGAFIQPAPPVPVVAAPATARPRRDELVPHPGVWCDVCGRELRGTRAKCNICPNYDICQECVSSQNALAGHKALFSTDREHTFRLIAAPTPSLASAQSVVPLLRMASTTSSERSNRGLVCHRNVICDACDQTIYGTRHKCLDCHNYDLCSTCYTSRLHNSRHQFVPIHTPGRVIVHRVYEDDERRSTNESPTQDDDNVIHPASCDFCDSRIRGVRYKCLRCPDFDTCLSCFHITPREHPNHPFVKIKDVQHLASTDPAATVRHSATCDSCNKRIYGIRYKCMHPTCPDYDLCDSCEAMPIPVHPSNHPLLKMRSPETIIPTVYRVGGTTLIPTTRTEEKQRVVELPVEQMISNQPDVPSPAGDNLSYAESVRLPEESTVELEMAIETLKLDESNHDLNIVEAQDQPETNPLSTDVLSNLRLLVNHWRAVGEGASLDTLTASTASIAPQMTEKRSLPEVPQSEPTTAKSFEFLAAFVADNNIEDGQVFPAGAEFVKIWEMQNSGDVAWPEKTELIFVAGDRLPAFESAPKAYHVGLVEPGKNVCVAAYDMKAPETPGRYIGYWRLTDGSGKPFGQSVWCDIVVVAPETIRSDENKSLSASEVIMPQPVTAESLAAVNSSSSPALLDTDPRDVVTPQTSVPSMTTVSTSSDDGNSSTSLLDEFETASDVEYYEASRSVTRPDGDVEYVVLYDDESDDE